MVHSCRLFPLFQQQHLLLKNNSWNNFVNMKMLSRAGTADRGLLYEINIGFTSLSSATSCLIIFAHAIWPGAVSIRKHTGTVLGTLCIPCSAAPL